MKAVTAGALVIAALVVGVAVYVQGSDRGAVEAETVQAAGTPEGAAAAPRTLRQQPAPGLSESAVVATETIAVARELAASNQIGEAMAEVAPLAAAGNAEAKTLMGELNVQRHANKRQARLEQLYAQLDKAPEDAVAQRYAIARELAKLDPTDADLVMLRDAYGELFADEVKKQLAAREGQ